jgi:hypothetical protein
VSDPQAYSIDSSLTTFVVEDDVESGEDVCARVVVDVDEHHGEFTGHPWAEIVVYGVALCERLIEVFERIGGRSFSVTVDSFICKR